MQSAYLHVFTNLPVKSILMPCSASHWYYHNFQFWHAFYVCRRWSFDISSCHPYTLFPNVIDRKWPFCVTSYSIIWSSSSLSSCSASAFLLLNCPMSSFIVLPRLGSQTLVDRFRVVCIWNHVCRIVGRIWKNGLRTKCQIYITIIPTMNVFPVPGKPRIIRTLTRNKLHWKI